MAVASVLVAGCSDGGGPGPDPKPTQYTKTLTPKDADTKATLSDAVTYNADTDAKLGSGRFSLKREAGTTLTLRTELSGYGAETTSISFHETGTVTITLTKDTPKSVAISYDIRDAQADSLVKAEADLTVDGSPVSGTAGKAKGTLTLPYGDSAVTICATADYFTDSGNCTPVTPDTDKPAHLTLSRKLVTVSVTVTDQSGGSIDDPSIQVDGYTYESGDKSHDFGARAGKRTVSAAADGYKKTAKQVSADQSQDVSLSLPRVYACNDGKDNDGDGRKDQNDYGCLDTYASTSTEPGDPGFVYEPEDDNETLDGLQRIFGINSSDTEFISGEKGHRENYLVDAVNKLPMSIKVGLDITLQFQALVSADQKGESFKVKVNTGPDYDHLNYSCSSEIVPDEGHDGWKDVSLTIPRSCFAHGTAYKIVAVYAGPDGSDSDVAFYLANQDYTFTISWFYEPEEVPENSGTSVTTGTKIHREDLPSGQLQIISKTTAVMKQ